MRRENAHGTRRALVKKVERNRKGDQKDDEWTWRWETLRNVLQRINSDGGSYPETVTPFEVGDSKEKEEEKKCDLMYIILGWVSKYMTNFMI